MSKRSNDAWWIQPGIQRESLFGSPFHLFDENQKFKPTSLGEHQISDDFGGNVQPKFHNLSCSSGSSWFTKDLNRIEVGSY